MHSVTDGRTDGRTDGQQDDANSRSYCVAVRSAKNILGFYDFQCFLGFKVFFIFKGLNRLYKEDRTQNYDLYIILPG